MLSSGVTGGLETGCWGVEANRTASTSDGVLGARPSEVSIESSNWKPAPDLALADRVNVDAFPNFFEGGTPFLTAARIRLTNASPRPVGEGDRCDRRRPGTAKVPDVEEIPRFPLSS